MAKINNKKTVFMAMSGGVDSSVAALSLKKKDYNVIGVFMRCYNIDDCAERDAEDARRVAEKLKIPFYVWDFEEEYKNKVVDYMVKGYKRGITPNPDVMCNKYIKFDLFLKKSLSMGANFIATGHYVRLRRNFQFPIFNFQTNSKFKIQNSKFSYHLFQARDLNKDQSYFLWTLTQKQLKYCLFPIGDYLKPEVRKIAKKAGLSTAEKKDSQGICFLGKVKLDDFLEQYIPEKKGDVLNIAGKKIGEHKGAHFYTIGQRHIKISNFKFQISNLDKNRKPFYVVKKDVKKNIVVVVEGDENPALYKKEIKLTDINFINSDFYSLIRANKRIRILTRVRYRQPLAKAELSLIQNSELRIQNYKLIFDEQQKFVASGQSAVFYDKQGEMLGGGVIDKV